MSDLKQMEEASRDDIRRSLNRFANLCHQRSVDAGWYTDLSTGERKTRNVPEMLALIHSEISEALEGYRKGLMDDKLPHRKMTEVEIADAMIRLGDLAGYLAYMNGEQVDVGGAVVEKMEFNLSRSDHKKENRVKQGGKQF